jgi:hypothetical protein
VGVAVVVAHQAHLMLVQVVLEDLELERVCL